MSAAKMKVAPKIPRLSTEQVADLRKEGEALRAGFVARERRRNELTGWIKDDIVAIATDAAWLYGEIQGADDAHLAVMERVNRTLGSVLIDIERNWNGAPEGADDDAGAEVPS